MTHTHAPRPTDLVALISFDGEVFENQAITREALGKPSSPPHALAATIQQWLGRGRRVWIDVRGRQIHGIATARPLASDDAWEIDTLVDAGGDDEVVGGLLAQASEAAAEAGVGRLILRLRDDAPALREAQRAGFTHALDEELWVLDRPARAPHDASVEQVRDAEEADLQALFQLYSRALPVGARQALGMTLDEWQGAQERRWLGRGAVELLADEGGRARAALQASPHGQLTLLVEPGYEALAEGLYAGAVETLADAERVFALQPDCLGTPAPLFRDLGFEPRERYALLAKRIARPLFEAVPSVAGRTVPTRG